MVDDPAGSMQKRMHIRTVIMLLVVLGLWGSAFAAIRVGLDAYAPGDLALLRFLVASIVLALYATCKRLSLPQVRGCAGHMVAGLTGDLGLQRGAGLW